MKITCNKARQALRDYLKKALIDLHDESDSAMEMLDAASAEGAIAQLEILWNDLLEEDPPRKDQLLDSIDNCHLN